MKLSDAEVLALLADAQKGYEQYLQTPRDDDSVEILPTYTAANPIGLVVNAIVD